MNEFEHLDKKESRLVYGVLGACMFIWMAVINYKFDIVSPDTILDFVLFVGNIVLIMALLCAASWILAWAINGGNFFDFNMEDED